MSEPNEFQLKCPSCENDGRSRDRDEQIAFVEWMAVYTNVVAQDGKTAYIDHANQSDCHDETKGGKLYCGKCGHTWRVPEEIALEDLEIFTGKTYRDLEE